MSGSIGEILNGILSDGESSALLSSITEKLKDESAQNSAHTQAVEFESEKQIMLQKKIDIIKALKPLLGEEFSKKADLLINALTVAKLILGLKSEFSE